MFVQRKGEWWLYDKVVSGRAKAAASESETNDARLKIIGY